RRRRQREEVGGDVARVLFRETEVWHHRHVLHLQLRAVVRAARVEFGVENKRQLLLLVVFGSQIALLFRTIRRDALTGIVNPANDVIEGRFLADALEVRGKLTADLVVAFADGVASETTAAFEKLFAVSGVAALLLGNLDVETVLPEVRRDGLDLRLAVLVSHVVLLAFITTRETPEHRHLRPGTE